MRRINAKSKRLANLLGLEPEQLGTKYPLDITLPDYIHTRILKAVKHTSKDGRERSIHLNYRLDAWLGGLMLRGTEMKLNKNGYRSAHANRPHALTTVIHRPHIALHTHPIFDGSPPSWLPSFLDIKNTYYRSHGSIANLVASEEGSFLYVKRSVNDESLFANTDWMFEGAMANREHQRSTAIQALLGVLAANGQDNVGSPESVRLNAVMATAQALDHKYICYVSEDLGNPQLSKIAL